MTAPATPLPPAAAPAPRNNSLITKNLTADLIQHILAGDETPAEVAGVLCTKITLSRCSALLQAEKAAGALADAPPEVKAAGKAEISALLKAKAPTVSEVVLRRIIARLGLPDEPLPYGEAHVQQARVLMAAALADCAVCVVDPVEFMEKFVGAVYQAHDSAGRLVYRLVLRVGDEELQVALRPSDFRGRGKASKKLKVPEALNDVLRARLGVEVAPKSAGDLLALIEMKADPETLHEELVLKAALRQLLLKAPKLPPNSYRGLWCADGLLFVPSNLAAEIADALAKQFGNKFAFTKLGRKFNVFAADYYRYYTPVDLNCQKPNCAQAYVFDIAKLAEFLQVPPETICQ